MHTFELGGVDCNIWKLFPDRGQEVAGQKLRNRPSARLLRRVLRQ